MAKMRSGEPSWNVSLWKEWVSKAESKVAAWGNTHLDTGNLSGERSFVRSSFFDLWR